MALSSTTDVRAVPDTTLLEQLEKIAAHSAEQAGATQHAAAFCAELRRASALARSPMRLAFLGKVGVGKTTAICRLLGLHKTGQDGTPHPLLHAAGGRTTICPVEVRRGPSTRIIIDKYANADEFEGRIEHLVKATLQVGEDGCKEEPETELFRGLRNMTRCTRARTGESDPIVALQQEGSSIDQIVRTLVERARYEQRATTVFPIDGIDGSPSTWIEHTFKALNLCQRDEAPLPLQMCVEVGDELADPTVKHALWDNCGGVLDTRGLDGSVIRRDITDLAEDPHSVLIVCSEFNSAPEHQALELLRFLRGRSENNDYSDIIGRMLLLVLPKRDEALCVLHDDGESVQNAEQGYGVKLSQIREHLAQVDASALKVAFFNARLPDEAEVNRVRRDLSDLLVGIAERRLAAQNSVKRDIVVFLAEKEASRAREHSAAAITELSQKAPALFDLMPSVGQLETKIKQEIVTENARRVWAATNGRNRGDYRGLNAYDVLAEDVRSKLQGQISSPLRTFQGRLQQVAGELAALSTSGILHQLDRDLANWSSDYLKAAADETRVVFRSPMKAEASLWESCEGAWGNPRPKKLGYRDYVAAEVTQWMRRNPDRLGTLDQRCKELWQTKVASKLRERLQLLVASSR